jgi:WD40 repeat protein
MSQDALQITAREEGSDDPGDIVFLCHNSADKVFIRRLADALELEFGTKFFLDVFAIPTGEAFIPWIEKALENCAVCAIFLGGNGWEPTHLWEAELALARYRRDPKFRIIPVALPGLSQQEAAKLGSGKLFQEVNWADFTRGPDDKDSLDKLEAALTGRKTLGYRGPARLTPYQVRRDAERWERSARRDRSILYGGAQLTEAEAMARDNPDAMAGVNSFISASRERQTGYWRGLAIVSAGVAVVLLIASAVAVANYLISEQRRLASVSRQLAIASREAPGADRALLISARAVLVDDTAEARAALLDRLQEFRFLKRVYTAGSYIEGATLRSTGDFLLATDEGLRRLLPGESTVETLPNMKVSAEAATAVVATGDAVWLGRENGRTDIVAGGATRTFLEASADVRAGRERKVRCLAYDKSKGLLAVGTGAGRIAIVRSSDASLAKNFDEGDDVRITALSFAPKLARLAVGTSGGTILIVDTEAMKIVERYPHVEDGVLSAGYLPDGSLVAVSSQGRLLYFDGRNPKLEKPSTGGVVPLATSAAIDPRTSRVAVGDSSGTVRLYDAATGQGIGAEPLRGHSDPVTAIVFGARKDLLSASANGSVALWDLAGRQGPDDELPQLNPSPLLIRTDADGAVVALSSDGNTAEVRRLRGRKWDLVVDLLSTSEGMEGATGFFRQAKKGADGFEEILSKIPDVAMDDDATRVAWTTSGGAILSMPIGTTGVTPTILLRGGEDAPEGLTLSGDGRAIAVIETGGKLAIFRLDEDAWLQTSLVPPSSARSLAMDQAGERLVIGMKDGQLAQYRRVVDGWVAVGTPWLAHASEVAGVRYSRDGRVIVSYGSGGGGADRTVTVSEANGSPNPRSLQARQAGGSVSAMSVGSIAGILAVGDHDGQVLTWSGSDLRFSGSMKASVSEISAIFVDEPRSRLLTSGGDGSFLSWSFDPARWIQLACLKANRGMSRNEWRELLPDDSYVASCTQRSKRGR